MKNRYKIISLQELYIRVTKFGIPGTGNTELENDRFQKVRAWFMPIAHLYPVKYKNEI